MIYASRLSFLRANALRQAGLCICSRGIFVKAYGKSWWLSFADGKISQEMAVSQVASGKDFVLVLPEESKQPTIFGHFEGKEHFEGEKADLICASAQKFFLVGESGDNVKAFGMGGIPISSIPVACKIVAAEDHLLLQKTEDNSVISISRNGTAEVTCEEPAALIAAYGADIVLDNFGKIHGRLPDARSSSEAWENIHYVAMDSGMVVAVTDDGKLISTKKLPDNASSWNGLLAVSLFQDIIGTIEAAEDGSLVLRLAGKLPVGIMPQYSLE